MQFDSAGKALQQRVAQLEEILKGKDQEIKVHCYILHGSALCAHMHYSDHVTIPFSSWQELQNALSKASALSLLLCFDWKGWWIVRAGPKAGIRLPSTALKKATKISLFSVHIRSSALWCQKQWSNSTTFPVDILDMNSLFYWKKNCTTNWQQLLFSRCSLVEAFLRVTMWMCLWGQSAGKGLKTRSLTALYRRTSRCILSRLQVGSGGFRKVSQSQPSVPYEALDQASLRFFVASFYGLFWIHFLLPWLIK